MVLTSKDCKKIIVNYLNKTSLREFKEEDILEVWYCKTLQNVKGWFFARGDDRFIELTYDGDNHRAYLDVYMKQSNTTVNL